MISPIDGGVYFRNLKDGDIIPFRRRPASSSSSSTATPSSGSNAAALSPISALSPTSASSPTSALSPASALPLTSARRIRAAEPPLASAHLLYIREILIRIAHMMGAAGHTEYDYWDDDDDESVCASDPEDDESVCASDPEEEETGKPSKPGQAKEKTLQVAAWLDEVKPSRIDKQRMDRRRSSWLAEMTPRIVKMLRGDPNSRSKVSFYSASCLLSARDSRKGSFNVERLNKAREKVRKAIGKGSIT